MDMNLQKYLSFVKTVEYGSFTRAAEILHYSQSGVSRMIGDLEKDWNMVLLERGKGGVRLTSNGLHMLPYAKELVADYEKMQMQVNALNGTPCALIMGRVSCMEVPAVVTSSMITTRSLS